MNKPRLILNYACESPTIEYFVEAWKDGAITWEDMLYKLGSALEAECKRLAGNSRIEYLKKTTKTPVALDLTSAQSENPLERQSKLIDEIVELHCIWLDIMEQITSNQLQTISIKLNLSDETKNNILGIE